MTEEGAAVYSIGAVARLTGIHQQTIRQYEKLGLLEPRRTPGGTRMFSLRDVERLQAIACLTQDMGVNPAGVELILRMRERERQLIALIRELFSHVDDVARARFESLLFGSEPGLIPTGQTGLARTEQGRGSAGVSPASPERGVRSPNLKS